MRAPKSIVFLLVAAFVLISGAAGAAVVLDRIVAVVNNEVITWGELYDAMRMEMAKQLQSVPAEDRPKIMKANEASFLQGMIDVRLQLQEARKSGIAIVDEDIDAAIENLRKRYGLSGEQFQRQIRDEGLTVDIYRARLSEQITLQRLIDRTVREKIHITEEDMKKAEAEGELYRIRQIFFRPGGDEKASTAYAKLMEGEDFSSMARARSEDPSAKRGGDLGFIRRSHLAKEFLSALKDMKPGDVSKPFKGEKGIHILKLEQLIGVREALLEDMFQERYAGWLRGLREKSLVEIRLR